MPGTTSKAPPKVIAVVGPTATGKTALGIHLAKVLETEVVSADSQVIYRKLDIGTAKPTPEEMQGVPHHMIGIADPNENFSVARYQTMAQAHLEQLWQAGKIPVVVGGTGFYLRALLETEFLPDVKPDSAFRERMNAFAEAEGPEALFGLLREKDPVRAEVLHPNDRFRVIRALEIIEHTGGPVPNRRDPKALDITWIGLAAEDRDWLRARLDRRIDVMLDAGWLDEVRAILGEYGPDARALGVALGYPEWVAHLQGKLSFEEARAQICINSHQYARRQMTWFRSNPAIQWLAVEQLDAQALRDRAIHRVTASRNG